MAPGERDRGDNPKSHNRWFLVCKHCLNTAPLILCIQYPFSLTDCLQGPSWSGIDHGGHWKLLMYGIRRFFSPVLVSGTYNASQADALSVYITNDQPWAVKGENTSTSTSSLRSLQQHWEHTLCNVARAIQDGPGGPKDTLAYIKPHNRLPLSSQLTARRLASTETPPPATANLFVLCVGDRTGYYAGYL